MKTMLSVDPGTMALGLVWWEDDRPVQVMTLKAHHEISVPERCYVLIQGMKRWIKGVQFVQLEGPDQVICERPGYMVVKKNRGRPNESDVPSPALMTLREIVGAVEGLCSANDWPVSTITPAQWRATLPSGSKLKKEAVHRALAGLWFSYRQGSLRDVRLSDLRSEWSKMDGNAKDAFGVGLWYVRKQKEEMLASI